MLNETEIRKNEHDGWPPDLDSLHPGSSDSLGVHFLPDLAVRCLEKGVRPLLLDVCLRADRTARDSVSTGIEVDSKS